MAMDDSRHCFSWALALVTVTAYSFNSQVFVWIGSADFGGKLFELFLFHVLACVFLVYYATCGATHFRTVLAEKGQGSMGRFAGQVLVGAFFQMVIYYLWFRASLKIPTQLLAAVFQSSIVWVYVLSVVFLREPCSRFKSVAVVLAVLGVFVASFASQWLGRTSGAQMPGEDQLLEGVLLALGAEVSKASYQVWFKCSFGEPSPRFALLFGGLVGAAHLFPILPLIMLLNFAGVHDARMTLSSWTAAQAALILLGATIAATVNVGSLAVISLRSPIFWSSVQMLAIPLSVLFDFLIRGIVPSIYNGVGYLLIMVACLMLTGVLRPSPPAAAAAAPKECTQPDVVTLEMGSSLVGG